MTSKLIQLLDLTSAYFIDYESLISQNLSQLINQFYRDINPFIRHSSLISSKKDVKKAIGKGVSNYESKSIWEHEKCHLGRSLEWGINGKIIHLKVLDSYMCLFDAFIFYPDFNNMSFQLDSKASFLSYWIDVLRAPQEKNLDYTAENNFANIYERALKQIR
jgi:hypothetical protein